MSLESFKEFVKKRPNLINYVETKEKTWQEFYNLYTLYGENSNIWDKYNNTYITKPTTLKDVFNIFKDIDMDLCDVCKLTFVCDTYQNASKIRDKFQWAYEDILDSAIIEEYPPGAKPIAVYILRMIILCDNNKSIKWKDLLYYEE